MLDAPLLPVGTVHAPMLPHRYRVVGRRQDGADTVTLTLAPVDAALPEARPGQFFMLWAFGVGEVPISLGMNAADGTIEETIRAVGAVTEALVATPVDGVVGVRGPFGNAWDLAGAGGGDLLFVAGGVGLVPLRPAVLEALADPGRFRRVAIVVGARTPGDLLFQDELAEWGRRPHVQVVATVDHADRSWHGAVGVVTEVLDRVDMEPSEAVALVCGPEVMMRFTAQALIGLGVHPRSVQVSLERNMKCAVGHCGHCQLGGSFVCLDGPVFDHENAAPLLRTSAR